MCRDDADGGRQRATMLIGLKGEVKAQNVKEIGHIS